MPLIPRIGTDEQRQEWILNSPPLIIGAHHGTLFIKATDLPGIGLHATRNIKGAPEIRLGKLYELLMEDLLQGQILHHGKQLILEGKTLGEIDFVLNATPAPIHLETSIKFYIEWAPGVFIGPNGKDELDIKFKHMAERQSRSLNKHYSMLELHSAPTSCCLMNGILFRHLRNTSTQLPPFVNPQVHTGVWMFESEIAAMEDMGHSFQPLHKHDWMLDICEHTIDFNEVRKLCLESTQATMVNVVTQRSVIHKVFVVKDVLKQSVPHPYTPQ